MDVQNDRPTVPSIAAVIGEPARARMLYCLLDDRARTATALAIVARLSPSTASVHLGRLKAERLLKVAAQGKHRYYALQSSDVAAALEALGVLAGEPQHGIATRTPANAGWQLSRLLGRARQDARMYFAAKQLPHGLSADGSSALVRACCRARLLASECERDVVATVEPCEDRGGRAGKCRRSECVFGSAAENRCSSRASS